MKMNYRKLCSSAFVYPPRNKAKRVRLSKHADKRNGPKTFDCIYYDIWRDKILLKLPRLPLKCMAEDCESTTE